MGVVVRASRDAVERAAELLRAGELVCFPTETVYGVAANAADPAAVGRIFEAKGRPADHPLIVHLPAAASLDEWAVEVPAAARSLADRFWPGPLTLVLRRSTAVPPVVTGHQETVALRVPAHPLALRLLQEFGGALAAPSANRFGRISPTTAQHADQELGHAVALVVDGGPTPLGVESTILDLSGEHPRLLRPGGLSRARLSEALGRPIGGAAAGAGPRAPGRLASHYAPSNPAELLEPTEIDARLARGEEGAVLSRRSAPPGFEGLWRQLPADPRGYARELYAALRELDAGGRRLLIEEPPRGGDWEAVNDRLARATGREDRS